MNNKAQAELVTIIVAVAIVIIIVLVGGTRNVTEIHTNIHQDKIGIITVQPKEIRYIDLLSKPLESSGNYRLYLSIKNTEINEVIFIDAKNAVGEGDFIFSIPRTIYQETWEAKLALKKYDANQLKDLEEKCIRIEWAFGIPTNKGEIVCDRR